MTTVQGTPPVIHPRYHGPPNSGNGGYACGLIADQFDGQVRVTLRRPPPLGMPITVGAPGEAGSVDVHADGLLIATTSPSAPLRCDPPRAVTIDEATAAAAHYRGRHDHPLPTCWVCGPGRSLDDGLRIFPGAVTGSWANHVAAPWIPGEDLDDGRGEVLTEHLWAALDCPSYFGLGVAQLAVLGSLTVTRHAALQVGENHVVHGWTRGQQDGRRLLGASAITNGSGQLVASAESTWVAISDDQLARIVGGGR